MLEENITRSYGRARHASSVCQVTSGVSRPPRLGNLRQFLAVVIELDAGTSALPSQ